MYYRENFSKTLKNRRSGTDAQLRIELLLQHHSRRFFIPKPFCVRQDNSSTCTLRLTRPFASSHSVHDHGEKMDANRLAESARLELASPEGRLVSTEVSYQLELTLQRPRYLFKIGLEPISSGFSPAALPIKLYPLRWWRQRLFAGGIF